MALASQLKCKDILSMRSPCLDHELTCFRHRLKSENPTSPSVLACKAVNLENWCAYLRILVRAKDRGGVWQANKLGQRLPHLLWRTLEDAVGVQLQGFLMQEVQCPWEEW